VTGGFAAALVAGVAAALVVRRPNPLRTRLAGRRPGLRKSPPRQRRPRSSRRWLRRHRPADRQGEVVAACLTLASELQAGAPAPRALAAVAADWPDLFGAAAGAAASGGDVPGALRVAAEQPGAAAVRALAAGWEVTERTGAPLARVVTTVGAALRADEAVRREAHSQLATARTTARLLAVLPVGTLLLLSGGDGEAFRFLLGSPYGWACVGAAGLFVAAGLSWVGRLARSATRSTWEW
jgi:tight adherence protein B